MATFLNTAAGKFITIITLLCLLLLAVDIASGYYLRHSGDDFVFSIEVAGENPLGFMWHFLTTLAGRFTNGFVIYLMYQTPGFFIKATPFFFISLFMTGGYLFIRRSTPINSFAPALLIAIILTFGLVMIPANQYQTIYWLPAYISYGLPLALLLILFAYLKQSMDKKMSYLSLGLLFVFAVLIGGLHELVAVLGGILLVSAWCLYAMNSQLTKGFIAFNKLFFSKSMFYLIPAFGFFVAFLVTYFAPATAYRRSHSPIQHEGKLDMLSHSWDFSVQLFQDTLMEPGIYFCLFAVLLTCLVAFRSNLIRRTAATLHPLTAYLLVITLFVLPFLSLYVTALSARYGYGTPPPERTNLIFYFTLVFCTVLLGIVLSSLAIKLSKQAFIATIHVSILLLLVFTLLSLFTYTPETSSLTKRLKEQAIDFDGREKYIKEQVKMGNRELLVPSLEIGDTPYPKNDPKVFPNKSIARYYGIDSLTAYGYPVY